MILIYIIFLMAMLGNGFIDYGLIPHQLSLLSEASIYLLFLYSLITSSRGHRAYRLDMFPLFLIFMIGSLFSIIINYSFNFQPIFGFRLILRFFIFYLALINLGLNSEDFKKINRLLFVLFIIQLPVSAVKLYFHGVTETTHGTFAGGGLTTIIPIVAIGYLSGFFAFYKPKAVYWFLAICFILYGIVGAKAALLFLYPLTFLGLYYLIYVKGKSIRLTRHFMVIIVLLLLSSASAVTIVKLNVRLNPERVVGGSVDFKTALQRSKDYTTGTAFGGTAYTAGRFSTTMWAFNVISHEGIGRILFGFGPGSLTRSVFGYFTNAKLYSIAKSYGQTAMVYILIEEGLFGVIVFTTIFLIFLHRSWKWYFIEKEPYWKAFSLGTLVFAALNLFIYFTYNRLPVTGDTVPPLYYYVMAIIYYRLKESPSYKNNITNKMSDKSLHIN
jgi:hypothetical protein